MSSGCINIWMNPFGSHCISLSIMKMSVAHGSSRNLLKSVFFALST
jgi:hypothetical protein